MRLHSAAITAALLGLGVGPLPGIVQDASHVCAAELTPPADAVRPAIERALLFLQKDAVKWRAEHQCATCHHGALTVWTLHDARERGYAVEEKTLSDAVAWSKGKFIRPFDPEKDLKPHWNVMPMAMVMMTYGASDAGLPGMTPADFDTVADHLVKLQGKDGAWLTPPPANGPVPFFESQEVLTLWAYLALERYVPADSRAPSPSARQPPRTCRRLAAEDSDRRYHAGRRPAIARGSPSGQVARAVTTVDRPASRSAKRRRRLEPDQGPGQRRFCHRPSAVGVEPGRDEGRAARGSASGGLSAQHAARRRLVAYDSSRDTAAQGLEKHPADSLFWLRVGHIRAAAFGREIRKTLDDA